MIEFKNVTKRYGERTVVDSVSFRVDEGETLVLLGPSGCGKTSCLKMMNRLVEPTAGTITVFGQDVASQPPESLRRRIGYVIQSVGLFPHRSVAENIATVPALLGWEPPRIDSRVAQLLDLVGLPPERFADLPPARLSGGQQQRVGLARALAGDPPVVLLDEPFGALDPVTRYQMQSEFQELQRTLGKTMVLVTHDVEEAVELGHRICLMNDGRIEQLGEPRALLLAPASDFVRSFFDKARLCLELKALTLADLRDLLSPTSAPGTDRRFQAHTPLSAILGEPGLGPDDGFVIEADPEGPGLGTTLTDVLRAYYRYREGGRARG